MNIEREPLTYTVLETCRVLQISRGACYEAIRQGLIPSLRFGRAIRIPRCALEQLLSKPAKDTHAEEVARA